jgi:hypothetical protein
MSPVYFVTEVLSTLNASLRSRVKVQTRGFEWVAQVSLLRPGFLPADGSRREHQVSKSPRRDGTTLAGIALEAITRTRATQNGHQTWRTPFAQNEKGGEAGYCTWSSAALPERIITVV